MSTIDWDHRELCPDGACNGVVSDEGVCKVCGKAVPNWGDERMRGHANEPEDEGEDEDDEDLEDDDEDLEDDDDDEEADDDEPDAAIEASGEWTERKLCDDGACIGVIGSDGKCTVCGKRSAA